MSRLLTSPRLHRAFYDRLAIHFGPDARWQFMNYGLDAERFREHPVALRPEDEVDRLHIQLYQELLSGLPVASSKVLEVGSGRGGGIRFIHRYLEPALSVGLDLSEPAIRLSAAGPCPTGLSFPTDT